MFLCNSVANFIILQPVMKARSFILRVAAFFLILVFSQKAGAGLFYHDLFHKISTTELPAGHQKEVSYNCTCIDDFLMPFTGSDELVFTTPVSNYSITNDFFEDRLAFQTLIQSSLRGPPAYVKG